jgi:hypothetical protein
VRTAYDIFKHNKPNQRVVDPKTGRHGVVKEIRETAYEWIEPFVLWDGETELKKHSAFGLELEDQDAQKT